MPHSGEVAWFLGREDIPALPAGWVRVVRVNYMDPDLLRLYYEPRLPSPATQSWFLGIRRELREEPVGNPNEYIRFQAGDTPYSVTEDDEGKVVLRVAGR